MAKDPAKDIELHPDAWARFERAAGVVAKTPPQHRVAKESGLSTPHKPLKEKPKAKKAPKREHSSTKKG
jgi:hypothetical protein